MNGMCGRARVRARVHAVVRASTAPPIFICIYQSFIRLPNILRLLFTEILYIYMFNFCCGEAVPAPDAGR